MTTTYDITYSRQENELVRTINDTHWTNAITLLVDIRDRLEFPKSIVAYRQGDWKFVVDYVDGVRWDCSTYFGNELVQNVRRTF